MFDKILVPLDGSELAERSLETAATLARDTEAEIVVLRVPVLKGYQVQEAEPAAKLDHQEAHEYLKEVLSRPRHPTITMRPRVIVGDEASVIVDTAEYEAVDLLVMSTHGRSGFSRWLLGSIAERVLRSAPCPMLVVRSDQPIRKMAITLDGSALAETVLAPGLELARRMQAQVTLLRVEEDWAGQAARLKKAGRLDAETVSRLADATDSAAYLQKMADEASPGVEVKTVVLRGPVAQEIVDFAAREEVDLIAMATHGFTALRRWPYGQITEKVMRGADASLLIIRPPAEWLY